MKILWVKSGGFLPLDTGGKIRSYNLLRELARRHEVSVFTFYPQHQDDRHSELEEFCSDVILQPLALPSRASLTDMIAYGMNMFRPVPYSMVKYCRPEVGVRLRQLLAAHNYDAIICDFLLTAAVIPWDYPAPKILFTHNVEAVIWERHWRVGRNPLWKMISWREYKTMARVERMYLRKADHILTVSDLDRDVFSRVINAQKITTIPTGVDIDYFIPNGDSSAIEENNLVFTGSMDWLPNEDAIVFFAEKILPIIQKQLPAVKLWVVGRKPTQKVLALAEGNPAIEVTGAVPDIRPYMKSAAVYVVPLRIGGGTRIKIFEAMSAGKAVVSTSIGAEGLPVTNGEDIFLADQPDDFAAAVVRLVSDTRKRNRISRAARELVQSRYSWSGVTDVLETVLVNAVEQNQPGVLKPVGV